MKILLIGSGGREHALGLKLIQDDPSLELHSAPGNPGLAKLGPCHDIGAEDVVGLLALAEDLKPDFTLIGPEAPLTLGLADELSARGMAVFGPSAAAAQLEASKSFAKEAMNASGIPTAKYEKFEGAEGALAALNAWPQGVVVKADGLAAGKGVVVCGGHGEAREAIEELSQLNQPLILEELMEGPEVSLFALVFGEKVIPLTTAQDHKRVGEGDTGLNTGGMGAYSPAPLPEGLDTESLCDLSVRPLAKEMVRRGTPFNGVMFVGLMLTEQGPKVLEYNVRFGDPECQVLMKRLKSPLLPLLKGEGEAQWHNTAAMTVVLAAEGYPGVYEKGRAISAPDTDDLIHAGTKLSDGQLVTSGGRVMNAVGSGATLQNARDAAYALAEQVSWDGMFYRRDIGWRAL